MIAATICSGIGAPEVAMPDWEYAFQSEIEAAPREVLKFRHRAQDARFCRGTGPALWGDFTAIRVRFLRRLGIKLPEWLIAGTPCQAFSIAGLRQSLADGRGNLTLEFVRLAHSLRCAGSLRGFTWENVPGVLSTKDNAFGCFLAAVVGADAPLRSPLERGRWPDAGMVAGPWARAAWRILDAQFFGVPQRRRRVFVVVSFGDGIDPAAVLFERHSLSGHPAPRREKGQAAPTLPSRSSAGGGLGTDFDCDGGLIPSTGNVAHCLNAGGMGRQDYETETLIAHSLRAEGFDAGEDGTGRGTPLVPVCFSAKDHGADAGDLAPTLRAGGHSKSHANAGVMPAVAFDTTQITSDKNYSSPKPGDPCHPLAAGAHPPAVAASHVRRLTPREAERLQGFPDDFTLVPYRKGMMADGPRYKMLGNSMCVNVMAWLGQRIALVDAIPQEASRAA